MTPSKKNPSDQWTSIWNIFDPGAPLVGVELEPCYVEREASPVAALTLTLQPDRIPQKVLFTGQRGSGKTSALVRLARGLGGDYLVVWIDLEKSLDTHSTSILDLLLALGGGIYKVARAAGLEPAPEPWQEMVDALNTLLAQVSAAPDAASTSPYEPKITQVDAEDFLNGMVCARSDPAEPLAMLPSGVSFMKLELDRQESLRVGPVLREMVGRINSIIADVEGKAGLPLLVIVDGMDKLPRSMAEAVFEHTSALVEILCRTVYTVTYSMYVATGLVKRDYFNICDLPNVKLHPRSQRQTRHEPGFDVMRQVVEARLSALGLDPETMIAPEALDKLIWGSGGVMRVLMRLVRDAAMEAQLTEKMLIESAHADAALEADQKTRHAGLSPDKVAYLHNFEATGQWQDEKLFLKQLDDGNIVAYADRGRVWYDVHPNVLPLLEG